MKFNILTICKCMVQYVKYVYIVVNQHSRTFSSCKLKLYTRGVKLIFTGDHISLVVAFKGPNVILGLYKCNYS